MPVTEEVIPELSNGLSVFVQVDGLELFFGGDGAFFDLGALSLIE